MLKNIPPKLAAFGLVAALCAFGAGFSSPAIAIDAKDKSEIEQIIHDYLVANPEILVEMQSAYEAKQNEAQQARQKQALASKHDQIFNSKYLHVIGNPDGKITLVEFFDYNCGYCRKAVEDMDKIIEKNKDVKFVVREFPVLGPDSDRVHRVATAFARLKPESYPTFHRALLTLDGHKDEAAAMAMAIEMGADKEELKKAMQDPEIEASFKEAYNLANNLGISGTPSYVIGDQVLFGAIGHDQLQPAIDAARK